MVAYNDSNSARNYRAEVKAARTKAAMLEKKESEQLKNVTVETSFDILYGDPVAKAP